MTYGAAMQTDPVASSGVVVPPGTEAKAEFVVKKKEIQVEETVECDCGTPGCSCGRRPQETARRLQTKGTKTIMVTKIVYEVEVVFTFTVTAEALAGGATAAAVVASVTKAVEKATDPAAKKEFWKNVAKVVVEKKDEIAEAVAVKMTEQAAKDAKPGETPKVYTVADVKEEVNFDEVIDTVQSDEFLEKAVAAPSESGHRNLH